MAVVSIIVPVYNTPGNWFRECMESVRKQSWKDWEAILIDDGSSNGTEKICDEYAGKDPRFLVVHQKNRGVSAARNAGIQRAKGEWLIFLDPDDWWEEGLLECLLEKLKQEKRDVLSFSFFVYTENSQKVRYCFPEEKKGAYKTAETKLLENMQIGLMDETSRQVPGYFGSPCMQIINRKFAENAGLYFDETLRLSEDALYDMKLLENVKRAGIWDVPLYHYRFHGESACRKYSMQTGQAVDAVNLKFWEFFEKYKKGNNFEKAYQMWLMKNYIRILKLDIFHPSNPNHISERKRQWKEIPKKYKSFQKLKQADVKEMFLKRKSYAVLWILAFRLKWFWGLGQAFQWFLKKDKI